MSRINPPKTQGILELHHKSTKRTVLSSSKERIDNLVACLVECKEAKRRAYNVQVNNWNFKLPKLVKETWRPRKRKMHTGPGFYQQRVLSTYLKTIMLKILIQHQFTFHRYYILIFFHIWRKRRIIFLSVDYLPLWCFDRCWAL